MSTRKRVTVAEYIEQQIALSEKSQKEISVDAGFEKPNVLSMIKSGATKLPINRVGPLAKALGVDPVHLLRLALSEYLPDTFEAIEEIVGQSLVTPGELEVIEVMRKAADGVPIEGLSDRYHKQLTDVVRQIALDLRRQMKEERAGARAVRGR